MATPPKLAVNYNVDASWRNSRAIIGFTSSYHTSYIIHTWHNPLFTTSTVITKALAFNAVIEHALTRQFKEFYIESDAKFIVQALSKEKWKSFSNNVKEVILKGQDKLHLFNMISIRWIPWELNLRAHNLVANKQSLSIYQASHNICISNPFTP